MTEANTPLLSLFAITRISSSRISSTGQNLREHGHQSASQIKEEVSAAAHGIFDLRAEGPQENHVPDDVRPAAMHEHRSEDGDPVMAGNDLRWNGGPLQDECVTTHQLKQKNEDIHYDNERRDH